MKTGNHPHNRYNIKDIQIYLQSNIFFINKKPIWNYFLQIDLPTPVFFPNPTTYATSTEFRNLTNKPGFYEFGTIYQPISFFSYFFTIHKKKNY